MNTFDVYKDLEMRTDGEIYIGVVGPVRTGKSTFIKRFMDVLVLPNIEDEHDKSRTRDELPQSAAGRTIMTTEPKFVPQEAAEIRIMDDISARVRLIDCVGYLVGEASGYMENDEERQVKTPWFDHAIPFSQAAEIGTRKVITEHSTIGIVVTTDGSIGEISRESYIKAEEKTINELQKIGKPFIVLVNSQKPYSEETQELAAVLAEKYKVITMPVNCEQLKQEDIKKIMENILLTFPVSKMAFYIPGWVEMLPSEHKIKKELITCVKRIMDEVSQIKDLKQGIDKGETQYISEIEYTNIFMDSGEVEVEMKIDDRFYYDMLSEMTGNDIRSEYDLLNTLKQLSVIQQEYNNISDAMQAVRMKGYGVVNPKKEQITVEEPVIIRQGNKFGVRIHSTAPSIHMIRANIETEIAPIVGNEKQAEDLIDYIKEKSESPEGVWSTNIFGKSIEELVMDGMHNKIMTINDESQVKLQDTMQKIVNDSNGGMVCIII